MSKVDNLNLKDIWPQERDYVVRPERLKYVRRLHDSKTCVFCQLTSTRKFEQKGLVYKGREALVVLNKYPYNSGHVLVMPHRHVGHLEDLTASEYTEVCFLVRESVRILKKVYSCTGLNVGLNLGAAAGAGIPNHVHYHVLPRWHGDTNFFPLIAETKLIVESLATTFKRLRAEFSQLEVSPKKLKRVKIKKNKIKTTPKR